MTSHPLYISTSYPLYTTTYSLYLYHHSHCTCVSHLHFPWYHTLCIHDIAPTICLTPDTLYEVLHPQFMTSHQIIYDITCTVFMSSLPRYLTLHRQYLCPHNPSTYDLWTLYVWHDTHLIYDISCTIQNVTSTLWVHTVDVTTLNPLHSWPNTQYIQHHTHDNTKVLSGISPCYLKVHPLYLCHQTQCINCITPSLCMTLHTMYDTTFIMHDITWTLYDITPI